MLRSHLKLTQLEIAKRVGISAEAWRYREREKEVYKLGELCALKDIVGFNWEEFGKVIEDCA